MGVLECSEEERLLAARLSLCPGHGSPRPTRRARVAWLPPSLQEGLLPSLHVSLTDRFPALGPNEPGEKGVFFLLMCLRPKGFISDSFGRGGSICQRLYLAPAGRPLPRWRQVSVFSPEVSSPSARFRQQAGAAGGRGGPFLQVRQMNPAAGGTCRQVCTPAPPTPASEP